MSSGVRGERVAPHIREISLTEVGTLGCVRFWLVMGWYKIQAGAGCEPHCSRDFVRILPRSLRDTGVGLGALLCHLALAGQPLNSGTTC